MTRLLQKITWWLFAGLSIAIGLYPFIYFVIDPHFGLLATKKQALLSKQLWNIGFYSHIVLGGIALLIGWSQFSQKLRKNRMDLHRTIGKVYVVSVLVSGISVSYTHLTLPTTPYV